VSGFDPGVKLAFESSGLQVNALWADFKKQSTIKNAKAERDFSVFLRSLRGKKWNFLYGDLRI